MTPLTACDGLATPYQGISYWRGWCDRLPRWAWDCIYRLRRRYWCPRGHHLFDEMQSCECHELVCDACGLTVGIAYFERGEMVW